VDGSRPLDDEDRAIFREVKGKRVVPVLNKRDLPLRLVAGEVCKEIGATDLYSISALRGDGVEALKRGMVDAIWTGRFASGAGELVPVNLRHKRVLERAKAVLEGVLEDRTRGIPWDLTAIEIRRALDILGEVVGETTPDEVLEMIFSRFCIGK
jgi:tRNA modification GTPase